ncbi:hypothetical protein DRJ16_06130 [Candidatus Woesearchaeota archaeon]|nr:MAG: hypothetical protein DRJ16_06130 [Candidatus Woesearchaeota archaeon]
MRTVRDLLGHKHISTTMIYAQVRSTRPSPAMFHS